MKRTVLNLLMSVWVCGAVSAEMADGIWTEIEILSPSIRGRCMEVLWKGIDSQNSPYSIHAAEGLTAAGQSFYVTDRLADRLKRESDERQKCCLMRELIRAGKTEYIQSLLACLSDERSEAHAHAAEGLYKTDAKVDAAVLEQSLAQETSTIARVWIAAVLAQQNHAKGVDSLKRVLYGGETLPSAVAAFVLGQTRHLGQEDLQHISTALSGTTNPFEKTLLVSGLLEYDAKKVDAVVTEVLRSPDAASRAFMASRLGSSQDPKRIAALLRLLEDENEDVRLRAAHTLIEIKNNIDKSFSSPLAIAYELSPSVVKSGQPVDITVSGCGKGVLEYLVATPYTVDENEALPGFGYEASLKWCLLADEDCDGRMTISTNGWKPGDYVLTLLFKTPTRYDYRDFAITVRAEKPRFEAVIEADHPIGSGARGTLGSFLKLKNGTVLAGSFMTRDGGLSWEASPLAVGYMACQLRSGQVLAFAGKMNVLSEGRYSMKINRYGEDLSKIESFDAVISVPQFTGGIAHAAYDAPVSMRSLLELEDGSLLASMYGRFKEDNGLWRWNTGDPRAVRTRSFVVRSTDGGRHWDYLATMGCDAETGMEGYNENVVGLLPDGRLLCLMRTGDNAHAGWEDNPLCASFSTDNGASWSRPIRTGVESVAPDFCVMQDGTVVCSYGRPGAHLMFSVDHGASWCDPVSIHPERYRGYTAVCEVEPGVLLVGYRAKNYLDVKTNTRLKDSTRAARVRVKSNEN